MTEKRNDGKGALREGRATASRLAVGNDGITEKRNDGKGCASGNDFGDVLAKTQRRRDFF